MSNINKTVTERSLTKGKRYTKGIPSTLSEVVYDHVYTLDVVVEDKSYLCKLWVQTNSKILDKKTDKELTDEITKLAEDTKKAKELDKAGE